MTRPWMMGAAGLYLAFVCTAARASAQASMPALDPAAVASSAEHRLIWNEQWPRFRSIGYAVTTTSIAGALIATLAIPYPEDPRWIDGVMFDGVVRHALRLRHANARDAIRLASDLTLLATLLQAGLIDGFLIPAADGNFDVAWQLTLMNAQALSLNILIATLMFKTAARARPPWAQCEQDPGFDPYCERGSFASFPSSHTSTAFTAAGLTCIHHANLPLYGGPPWDMTACVGALALASATGLFRIMGDRHYATDVLVGAAIGFSLGYVYPWLLHYRFGTNEAGEHAQNGPMWGLSAGSQSAPLGLSLLGVF